MAQKDAARKQSSTLTQQVPVVNVYQTVLPDMLCKNIKTYTVNVNAVDFVLQKDTLTGNSSLLTAISKVLRQAELEIDCDYEKIYEDQDLITPGKRDKIECPQIDAAVNETKCTYLPTPTDYSLLLRVINQFSKLQMSRETSLQLLLDICAAHNYSTKCFNGAENEFRDYVEQSVGQDWKFDVESVFQTIQSIVLPS